jgi:hypothetical protein
MTGRVVLLRTGPPGPLFSVADLAVLLAGGVPAVLPDLTREQLAALWPVVRPAAVLETVGDDALAADAGHARTPVLTVDERSTRPGGTPAQWRTAARRLAGRRLEQTAALVFTSGTTGVPRAVALTEAALVHGTDTWTDPVDRPARVQPVLPARLPHRPADHGPHPDVPVRDDRHHLHPGPPRTEPASTPGGHPARRPPGLGPPGRCLPAAGRQRTAAAAGLGPGTHRRQRRRRPRPHGRRNLRQHTGLRICGAYGATETTVPAFHQDDATTPGLGRPDGVDH